ncbi:LOW QUALITY PROTEIN: Hypothetical protein PHPALM_8828 [Phytophthora palmivora]|uniref:Uncharacterized protein n=1 Tax=Phytophthora palmivora TaxID=4796 RepID=A0A2P4Y8V8_9STRA|nr:LOW QUALITY PROTEIN: Hypothetical protein PHPALM_8828 [Phytophthora palmivora]
MVKTATVEYPMRYFDMMQHLRVVISKYYPVQVHAESPYMPCITRNSTHRLFSTILGMTVVDAFLAHRYDSVNNDSTTDSVTFHEILSQLAHQLIFNNYQST